QTYAYGIRKREFSADERPFVIAPQVQSVFAFDPRQVARELETLLRCLVRGVRVFAQSPILLGVDTDLWKARRRRVDRVFEIAEVRDEVVADTRSEQVRQSADEIVCAIGNDLGVGLENSARAFTRPYSRSGWEWPDRFIVVE